MPIIVRPVVSVHHSYLAGLEEFRAEGRLGPGEESALASEAREVPSADDADGFARYVDERHARALEETPRPEGWVPATLLWYIEFEEWIGRLVIRHRLTPSLLETGGHILEDERRGTLRYWIATGG